MSGTIRFVAELSSILTIAAFLISAVLLNLAMIQQNLSFIELVTVEDVIREGVASLLDYLMTVLSVALVVGLVTPIMGVWRPSSRWVFLSYFVFGAVIGHFSYRSGAPVDSSLLREPNMVLVLLGLAIAAWLVTIWIICQRKRRAIRSARFRRHLVAVILTEFRFAWIAIAFIAGGYAVASTWRSMNERLQFGQALIAIADIDLGAQGCVAPRLVWIGSENLAIRCQSSRRIVIRKYENVVLVSFDRYGDRCEYLRSLPDAPRPLYCKLPQPAPVATVSRSRGS